MTVTTVFATAPGGNGQVVSTSSNYSTARAGSSSKVAGGDHIPGQRKNGSNFECYEGFLIFDTSSLDDAAVISDVVLSCFGAADGSATDYNVIAASSVYDGGAVVTGDFVPGANLGALTTYATWATTGYSAAYNAFTSAGADFNSAINTTGNTPIILYSSRHQAGNQPSGNEYVIFTDADAAGTTSDPKLDITHDAAASSSNGSLLLMGVGT